jgi:hypothetical protein
MIPQNDPQHTTKMALLPLLPLHTLVGVLFSVAWHKAEEADVRTALAAIVKLHNQPSTPQDRAIAKMLGSHLQRTGELRYGGKWDVKWEEHDVKPPAKGRTSS